MGILKLNELNWMVTGKPKRNRSESGVTWYQKRAINFTKTYSSWKYNRRGTLKNKNLINNNN